MPPKEIQPRLWSNDVATQPRVETYPLTAAAADSMREAYEQGLLENHEDGNFYSPMTAFALRGTSYQAEAHVVKKDANTTFLTICRYKDQFRNAAIVAQSNYRLGIDGTIYNLEKEKGVTKDTKEYALVARAVTEITDTFEDMVYKRNERRKDVRNAVIRVIGIAALTAGVGAAIYTGIKFGIVDPAERAEKERNAFDTLEVQLPGEGAPIDRHRFATLPNEEFDAIPDYGGSDVDFSQPRMVHVADTDSGCVALPGEFNSSSKVFVALPENSLYQEFHYGTNLVENTLSVCFIENISEIDETNPLEVAVQIN